MSENYTFTIIKPCATKSGQTGRILADIMDKGFDLVAMKFTQMNRMEAEAFYAIHQGKSFFEKLVNFMTSGPILVAILSKENAVIDFRELLGKTDPKDAAEGTLRKKYGVSLNENALHGSDSDENAALESSFFFAGFERYTNYRT